MDGERRQRLRRARLQTRGLVAIAVGLYPLLRFVFGPLAQDPSYHRFADTQALGPIPRAADALSYLAIWSPAT